MEEELRFDGRVVIVTGAGAGLGRAYALLFGRRGAAVVVNDLGGQRDGQGKGTNAADKVVHEIRSEGGIAVPDYNSVVDGEKIVKTALDSFGRVDILVNNAGILRDKTFARISNADWDLVHNVHLKGAFKTTQAAWPHFRKQNYGRIIMTSSNSGLYGNFGQANYSAAKMGLIGLSNTLAIEGSKYNINCNVVVPTAASRLTEDVLPPEFLAQLKPELIAPVVAWMCHEECQDTGMIIETSAGWAAQYFIMRSPGGYLRNNLNESVSPEAVRSKWREITQFNNIIHYNSIQDASMSIANVLDRMNSVGSIEGEGVQTDEYDISDRFLVLYALGIGCSVKCESDMKYLYEGHEQFSAFPTYAILPGLMSVMTYGDVITTAIPDRSFDLSQVLHGEQYLELYQTFPTSGVVLNHFHVADVLDKGRNALVIVNVDTFDVNGNKLSFAQITIIVVGGGGFGGKTKSDKVIETVDHPNVNPDAVIKQSTSLDQAALYRLSGDANPLHIDQNFATLGGFKRPILHGLCSLGFSVRHVLSHFGNNDPSLFKSVKVRFVKPVFPGETLETKMWRNGNRIHFETSALESGSKVISGAYVDLHDVSDPIQSLPGSDADLKSDAVFQAIAERLKNDPSIAQKVKGVFVYNITKDGKSAATWTLDLKEGNKVYRGNPQGDIKTDTTLILDDEDMCDIAIGKLNPQTAFMKGKLKIRGNLMLTQKLKAIMTTEAKL